MNPDTLVPEKEEEEEADEMFESEIEEEKKEDEIDDLSKKFFVQLSQTQTAQKNPEFITQNKSKKSQSLVFSLNHSLSEHKNTKNLFFKSVDTHGFKKAIGS